MDCKNILVLNIGSTSFKFRLFQMPGETVICSGRIADVFAPKSEFEFCGDTVISGTFELKDGYSGCINKVMDFVGKSRPGLHIDAIAFKTVMAGDINYPCIITDEVLAKLDEYSFVAPAHNIPYAAAIRNIRDMMPDIPLVASFETAFHRTIPDYARVYPIDRDMSRKYSIRKYGFHGAAHSYVACTFARLEPNAGRIISVHLGGSSSVCAIKDGKSIDTSMGFSPQSGLFMNNRSGDTDVFAVLYLMEKENMSPAAMRDFLCTRCGLLGMSKLSSDMRVLEEKSQKTIDSYCYSVLKYIGAFYFALGGADLISFSGGIGENSDIIKTKICQMLDFAGVELDFAAMSAKCKDEPIRISSDKSDILVYKTPVNEEIMVARNTYSIIKGGLENV